MTGAFARIVAWFSARWIDKSKPPAWAIRNDMANQTKSEQAPEEAFDKYFTGRSKWFKPAEIRFLGASHYGKGNGRGLNEIPPKSLWPNIIPTLEQADRLREFFGSPLRILSGYRTPELNRAISGASGSLHMQFKALDLSPASPDPAEARRLKGCAAILHSRNKALKGGLGCYSWGVHLDCGPFREW